ncbi:hypothetical protein PSAC2689_50431 [Paraburkholderia sacchari]
MDASVTAVHGQNTTAGGRLYMAFELGEKNWKLMNVPRTPTGSAPCW